MKAAGYSFLIAVAIMLMFTGSFGHGRTSYVVSGGPYIYNGSTPPFAARGSMGPVTRSLSPIEGLEVDGSFNVTVFHGKSSSITLNVPPNALPYVRHEVENGVLHLYLKENPLTNTGGLAATVTLPKLTSLTVDGSGNVTAQDVDSNTLKVAIEGSSDVRLAGIADHLTVDIAGSGRFHGDALHSTEAVASISGSGQATVNATRKVESTVAGSGTVLFLGHPRTVTKTVTGSGSVEDGGY